MSEVLRLNRFRSPWRVGEKMVAEFKNRKSRYLRLPQPAGDQAQLIRAAAAVSHKTPDEFLLDSAVAQAHAVLDDERKVVLSIEAFEDFKRQLDEPPVDKPGLRALLSSTVHSPEV